MNIGKPTKRRRTDLSGSQRVEIASILDNGAKVATVMERFKISKRTVLNIKKARRELLSSEAPAPSSRMRFRSSKFPLVEQQLLSFLSFARSQKFAATARILQAKAADIAQQIVQVNASQESVSLYRNFKASTGWVDGFVKRSGLSSVPLHGETGSVKIEKVKGDIGHLREKLGEYDLRCIFHVGETGLFFQLLPKRTYISSSGDKKSVRGTKGMDAKDRITAIVCSNADGSLKIPVSVIGTANEPRCFHGNEPPVPYFAQKNAWSDSKTFLTWFHKVFLPAIRRFTSQNVALVMESWAGHSKDLVDEREQVTIFCLPLHCPVAFQPMDAGITTALKHRYRFKLLSEVVDSFDDREMRRENAKHMDAETKGLAEGHDAHVLDAVELLKASWDEIAVETLVCCWRKADILPERHNADLSAVYARANVNFEARENELVNDMCEKVRSLRTFTDAVDESTRDLAVVGQEDVSKWIQIEDDAEVKEGISEDFEEHMRQELSEAVHASVGPVESTPTPAPRNRGRSLPPTADIAKMFAPLENTANECGVDDACFHLRKAKQALLRAHFAQTR